MSAAIDAAVLGKLQGDTGPGTLGALAPGGVFMDVAPENVADPFVIVTLVAHEAIEEEARTAYERGYYLAKAVGKSTDGAATLAAASRIHALLQKQPLTITGFHWMDTVLEERVRYVQNDGPVYWQHAGGRYRVEADPTS